MKSIKEVNKTVNEEVVYKECGDFVCRLLKIFEGSEYGDLFEIEGISLWNVLAPLLAAYILPEGVLWYIRNGKWSYKLKYLFLRKIKKCVRQLFDILNIKKKAFDKTFLRNIEKDRSGTTKPILFLNFTPKHYSETFSNVSNLLKKDGYAIKVIGSYESSIPKDVFFDISGFRHRKNELIKRKIYEMQKQMLRLDRNKLFINLKKDFSPIWMVFKDNLKRFAYNIFPEIANDINVANRVISFWRPKIIISGDDCDVRIRVYFLLAQKENIPTLLIQQGLATYKSVDFIFLSTDKIAVIGEQSFKILLNMGISKERIIITGRPDFDNLLTKNSLTRDDKIINMQKYDKYILFTSQPFAIGSFKNAQLRNKIIEDIYSLALFDIPIVIKPHPGEVLGFHKKLARKYPQAILVNKDSDTNRLIKRCEIFISCFSTTIFQALIADKPVLIINYDDCSKHSPYYETEATICVDDPFKLRNTIECVLKNKEKVLQESNLARDKFIRHHTYLPDGKASERVKDVIIEMIKNT